MTAHLPSGISVRRRCSAPGRNLPDEGARLRARRQSLGACGRSVRPIDTRGLPENCCDEAVTAGVAEFGSATIRCSPFDGIFVETKSTDQRKYLKLKPLALPIYIGTDRGTQSDRDSPFCAGGYRAVGVKRHKSTPKPLDSNACERIETKLKSPWLLLSKVSSVCFVRARKVKA